MEEGAKNKASTNWMPVIGLVLVFVAIIVFIIFLLSGETTISGGYDGQKRIETLACESKEAVYPIFKYDNAESKRLNINAIFEDDELSSISLMYKLNYIDSDEIEFSEARNHSAMNSSFSNDGMKADSLSAKYGSLNDGLQFSIYAKGDDITRVTLKYFMLDKISSLNDLTQEKMSKIYNKIGLDCIIKK